MKKETTQEACRSTLCHFKDAGNQTITQIMQWSVMECDDPDVASEIQQLGTRLKLLISIPSVKEQ